MACGVLHRLVVLLQDHVGKQQFGFVPFVGGVAGYKMQFKKLVNAG